MSPLLLCALLGVNASASDLPALPSAWPDGAPDRVGRVVDGVAVRGRGWPAGSVGVPVTPAVDVAIRVPSSAAALRVRASLAGDAALLWLPDGRSGRLVWDLRWFGLQPWRAWVDAVDGRVWMSGPGVLHGDGRWFEREPFDEDLVEGPMEELAGDGSTLVGERVVVSSISWMGNSSVAVQYAEADADGHFLYWPDHTDPADAFAEVNAFQHLSAASNWFAERFGHPLPDAIIAYTNFREGPDSAYDNAYFTYTRSGDYQLAFGQGEDMDWSYDPGIQTHELGHGIVEDVAALFDDMVYPVNMDEHGLHPAPGGMTEGLPDYWAASRLDRSAQALFVDGTPIRDLDNDARCPDSIVGEAHADGEVIGGTTWEIRERIGADGADAVVYGAMQSLPASPSYADLGAGLIGAAEALVASGAMAVADAEAVAEIVAARGLARCGRDVMLAELEQSNGVMVGADFIDSSLCTLARNGGLQLTTPFQYTAVVPDDAPVSAMVFRFAFSPISDVPLEPDDLEYSAVVAQDSLVAYTLEPFSILDYTFPLPGAPVEPLMVVDDAPVEVRIDAAELGLDALPPGSSYTVSLVGLNCITTQYTVDVAVERVEVPSDSGTPELRGCVGLADRRAWLWPGLCLLGLGRLRRRR